MVGLSEPFKLLARREGPTESGYSYAMENDKGKLDWTEGKEKKGKRRALFKEWKTARWENLPLWNKVRAFRLEMVPSDGYSRRTAAELLTLANQLVLPQPHMGGNTTAEQWARSVVHSATLGKSSSAPGKRGYVIHPTWCCVVFCCHGYNERWLREEMWGIAA